MVIPDKIIGVIAPHNCILCGDEGSLLCAWCAPDSLEKVPSRCYKCYSQSADYATCQKCKRKTPLKHVWIKSEYSALAKKLISKLKFERAVEAAEVIGGLIEDNLPYLPSDTLVTHVPTATSRRRQRGYDQAELIAKSIALKRGLRQARLLARQGQSRQVGATRKKRLIQMNDAFLAVSKAKTSKQNILLVDDVLTTGASLEAAAKALRRAGAKQVYAVAFAHKK